MRTDPHRERFPMTILIVLMLIPILNWFAAKHFVPKQKVKRFMMWIGSTWLFELIAIASYIAVT